MLDSIIAYGNRGFHKRPVTGDPDCPPSEIVCRDGFSVSVIAGGGTYCRPRPSLCGCAFGAPEPDSRQMPDETNHDYAGPFTHVEVGFPSGKPEPWVDGWERYAENSADPEKTVYPFVPVEMVRDLIASHGGEAEVQDGR